MNAWLEGLTSLPAGGFEPEQAALALPVSAPVVSVIIPSYNRAELLSEAVKSVTAQTFRDFELIVADDGSTDGTAARLAALGFSSVPGSRLLHLRLRHGGTPGRARNRGAAAARGGLLAFLDSDDLWLPEKLERQLPLLRKRRISHTRELWLRNGREVSQAGQRHRREGDIFDDSLVKCVIGPSTVVLERGLFEECGGFREDMEIAEDYELWLRITAREDVSYRDEVLTIKRAGSGDQLSEKYGQIEIFRIHGLKRLVDGNYFSADPEKAVSARAELARKCFIHAAGCRKRGKDTDAAEYDRFAKMYAP